MLSCGIEITGSGDQSDSFIFKFARGLPLFRACVHGFFWTRQGFYLAASRAL